jgi:hypothetical protein
MGAIEELLQWVEKKPIIIKAFDEEDSIRFIYAKSGRLDYITFTRPHNEVNVLKLPTICLFELTFFDEIHCFIGVIEKKAAVSTLDSRLAAIQLQEINTNSLDEIFKSLTNTGHKNRFKLHIQNKEKIELLTPRLSSHIINILACDPSNQSALENVAHHLPGLNPKTDVEISLENALKIALGVFGFGMRDTPKELYLKPNSSSILSKLNYVSLLEDNVINRDAAQIDGFLLKDVDVTGRAVFLKNDERLEVYTANKNPLEIAFGVDLIYYNQILGSIVMVQYKMLEKIAGNEKSKWNFRLDHQTRDEISRMKIPKTKSPIDDYRLNKSPFYFKFVERTGEKSSIKSYVLSLDHLNKILLSPLAKGPRGGIRIDYPALEGSYLRETDFIGLIRSGYIGTHRIESEALIQIISEISKGNKELVLAWQTRIIQDE